MGIKTMKSLALSVLVSFFVLGNLTPCFAEDSLESFTGDVVKVREVPVKGKEKKKNVELVVMLDNGQKLSVVQEKTDTFKAGDEIRIFKDKDGEIRVRQ